MKTVLISASQWGLNPLIMLVAALCANTVMSQSPLDQPSQKKITVRSEIERAYSEIRNAAVDSHTVNALQFAVDLDNVADRNKSRNTDSDAFLLGASLGQWVHLEIVFLDKAPNQFSSAEDIQLARKDAVRAFSKMRELQAKLGIDDDALLSAADCKIKQRVKELMAKYRAGGGELDLSSVPAATPTLILRQSISIQLPSGATVLPAGTKMPLIGRG